MTKHKDYKSEHLEKVILHSSYLLNIKGNCWKINNGKRGILLNKEMTGKDNSSPNSISSNDEYFSPSSQPLTSWKCGSVNNLDISEDKEIHEMESLIKKIKLYLLQLETQLSELQARKQKLNCKSNKPTSVKSPPLVIIHRIPQSMKMNSFNEAGKQNSSQSVKKVNNSKLVSTQHWDDLHPHEICKNEKQNAVYKSQKTTPKLISPNLVNFKTNDYQNNTSDKNNGNLTTVSDAASMPCLSPFYHTSPGHYRKVSDRNISQAGSESLPEISVVISQNERMLANSNINNCQNVAEQLERVDDNSNINDAQKIQYEQEVVGNEIHREDKSNTGLTYEMKSQKYNMVTPKKSAKKRVYPKNKHKLLTLYSPDTLMISPSLWNNASENCSQTKKRNQSSNESKNAKFSLLGSALDRENNISEQINELSPERSRNKRSFNFMSRSLTSSDERLLFKDTCSSSDDSIFEIDEPPMKIRGLNPAQFTNKISPNYLKKLRSSAMVCCYVKLTKTDQEFDGREIYR